ncbi:MAG: vanadium-dependent haloperoxidase [Bacteroidota bacterium]|nr:vanadium-dependent haloperoxidase [Bacteroidota bacterium]
MKLLLFSSLLTMVALFTPGCTEEDQVSEQKLVANYTAEASLRWNNMFLEIERYSAGYRPGPAPRSLGLMGIACYEACVTGMPDYNSLETKFPGLNIPNVTEGAEYHWPTVIHAIYTTMMPRFFTDDQTGIPQSVRNSWNGLVNELNVKYAGEAGNEEVFNRSKAYGESVGIAVWDWSTTDIYGDNAWRNPFGNYNTNETYVWQDHYDGPGDWEPTAPGPMRPMGPFYGKSRLMVLKESERTCYPPSSYYMDYSENPNSEYYSQALQVYSKFANFEYQTKWIGEFWSDDLLNLTFSPGPRWLAVGNQVIASEDSNLEIALEAYAKVGLAISDAAVAAWHSKYYYNVERPDVYIRKFIDPAFKSSLDNPLTGDIGFTPPFPAYPSGHATMGAAGAEVLSSVFGYNHGMTDNCHYGRTDFVGTPRAFSSFEEMAEENAWSRVLLGVHFRMDADEGVRFGQFIGRKVNALPWKK